MDKSPDQKKTGKNHRKRGQRPCRNDDRYTCRMEKFSTATVTRDSVFKAIEQFDRIGQHAFLEKFALGQGAQKGNKVSGATSKAARCQVTGTFTTLGDVLFYDPSPVSKNAGSGGT